MRASANRFQALACVSKSLAIACRQFGYRTKVETILNGIEPFTIDREPQSPRTRVGFLGMNSRRKGFEVVEQWIRLDELERVEWCLYGDAEPSLRDGLARLQQDYPDQVIAPGRRPVKEIFQHIDVLVHPAVEYEPFGLVFLEAANCHIPSVASRCGGPEEIIQQGQTGYLFDGNRPEQGLEFLRELTTNADARSRMGASAYVRFREHFTAQRMATDYQAFWNRTQS